MGGECWGNPCCNNNLGPSLRTSKISSDHEASMSRASSQKKKKKRKSMRNLNKTGLTVFAAISHDEREIINR